MGGSEALPACVHTSKRCTDAVERLLEMLCDSSRLLHCLTVKLDQKCKQGLHIAEHSSEQHSMSKAQHLAAAEVAMRGISV